MDAHVERTILRCLSKRPADRPQSANDVAAALLAGDPLSAAIAAGETPSPEMVAASGSREGFRPAVAWALLFAVAAVLFTVGTFLNPSKPASAAFQTPPEALAHRARESLAKLGYPDRPADFAYGFERDQGFVAWQNQSQTIDVASPEWIRFWYRESPRPLAPSSGHSIGPLFAAPESVITAEDPPPRTPGMISLAFDFEGRLLKFDVVSSPELRSAAAASVDATAVLEMAGVDVQSLRPVEPKRMAARESGTAKAWEGTWPGRPDIPMYAEAVFADGVPIQFSMVGPWSETRPSDGSAAVRALTAVTFAVVVFVTFGGSILAWRNTRTGRADRRGAFRLSLFAFVSLMLAWILGSDHRLHRAELMLYLSALAEALYWSVLAGLIYLAVEPFVRRRWPHALISWNRVLEGHLGDSLVGRDILAGMFFGALVCISKAVLTLLGTSPMQLPEPEVLQAMHSHSETVAFLLRILFDGANVSLALFFLLSFFRAILGNRWIAMAVWMVLINVLTNLEDPQLWGVMVTSLFGVLWLVAVMRFGLLAGMAMWFADRVFRAEILLPPQAWFGGRLYLLIGAVAVLSIYAFRTSLGNQPILRLDSTDAR